MIINQVKTIIQSLRQYDQPEMEEDTMLIDNLGFTSLDIMNLIIALEQHFKITFRDQDLDLERFTTIGTVLNTLKEYPIGNP